MKETKFISEVEYVRFKDKLRSGIIMIIVGLVIGVVLGIWLGGGIGVAVMMGIMCAGMPYAWSVIPVIAIGWLSIIIKFVVAVFLGWIVTPIALVYNFIQMKRYEKAVQEHVLVEQGEKEEDVKRENANTDRIVEAINNK